MLYLQTLGTENGQYKDVYDNLMEIGLELNCLKNIYNISRVGFLLDSAVSSRQQDMILLHGENVTTAFLIFDFQTLLLQTLAMMTQGQRNYIVQYNEDSAWWVKVRLITRWCVCFSVFHLTIIVKILNLYIILYMYSQSYVLIKPNIVSSCSASWISWILLT